MINIHPIPIKDLVPWPWPNFSPEELVCKGEDCCDKTVICMSLRFMDVIQEIRERVGFPLPVTSAYRCPTHNARIGGAPIPHPSGHSIDFGVSGRRAFTLLSVALVTPSIMGIGVQQHKRPHSKRFIHLDDLQDSPQSPRPWVWSYK